MLKYFIDLFESYTIGVFPFKSIRIGIFSPENFIVENTIIDILTTFNMIQDTPINTPNTLQLLTDSVTFYIILIFLFGGILLMMLTPVLLMYYFIINYFDFYSFRNSINEALSQHDITNAKLYLNNYEQQICNGVLKAGSNAFASGFSLFSWVFFSATYMLLGFDNFIVGIKEYFFFPFNVLNRISVNNFNQLEQGLNANGIIMIGIVVMTICFYIIGYNIGRSIGESKIKKLESLVANN